MLGRADASPFESQSCLPVSFEINSEILEYVNEFLDDWGDVIGVHVRSWWSSGMPRYAWHDNKLYENEIDKFDSNKKILGI